MPQIEASGARLVYISSGATHFARAFREDYLADWPSILLLCDTEMKSYKALGLRRSILGLLSPRLWLRAIKSFRAGFRQAAAPQGDAFQNGGVLVLDGQGAVKYRFVSDEAGHHPDPVDVLKHL